MSSERIFHVVIIGGGPAGLTAGIYARRAGLDCLLIERGAFGGNMFMADRIENYPGFPGGVSGQDLSSHMEGQAKEFGVEFQQSSVEKIEIKDGIKVIGSDKGPIQAFSVVVATGCQYRRLGIPGEGKYLGSGVSYCATCDGNFFRGAEVAVIGGGDSAVQEALFLSKLASRVNIIHRRDELRACRSLQERAFKAGNINIIWDTVAESIEGGNQVEKLRLLNKKTGEKTDLAVEGVFIYVGVRPNVEFLGGLVELTDDGYIRAGEDTLTSVPGIFAAGDVRKKPNRQISTAVADGCNAITAAQEYLMEIEADKLEC